MRRFEYLSAWQSITNWANRWRITGSFASFRPFRSNRRAISRAWSIPCIRVSVRDSVRGPRSNMSVVMATSHPPFSWPRMFSAGTSMFSK